MTIHAGDPFATPDHARSPVRRLRGRLVSPVTLWTAGTPGDRAGLTVTSALVVDGDPGHLLGVVDPESELWEVAERSGRITVEPLAAPHRHLADVFGGSAPAPGGPFRLARWTDTEWGPVLADATTWCGATVESSREVGYGLLVDARIDRIEVGPDAEPVAYYRGRYRDLTPPA